MKSIILLLLIVVLFFTKAFSQNPPVAIDDNFQPIINTNSDTIIEFNVVVNDFDPDGDSFKIRDVIISGAGPYFEFDDTRVSVVFYQMTDLATKVFKYRICKTDDTTSVSNWAYMKINAAMSEDAPVALSDTTVTIPGYSASVNVLMNDSDPNGDSIIIIPEMLELVNDSTIRFTITTDYFSYSSISQKYLKFNYIISDTTPWSLNYDVGEIYIQLEHNSFYDSVNINNINARINSFGNHFWGLPGGKGSEFHIPNGSSKTAIFANTLWMGGLDENEALYLAADRYRQQGEDFWSGPIADIYDSIYDIRWFHAWKLSLDEIEYHRQNWWQPDYVCPEDIFTWPGDGDVNYGEAEHLAPYCDYNNNGIYDPLQGDYPYIKGDQAVFFIFNDARKEHGETGGAPMGIEIQGMAYAFDEPQDSALWNTLFLHYDIINRSVFTYHDVYLGSFTDVDLGYAWDDYIGSHIQGGFYYGYNGTDIDGFGQSRAYGEHPPAMGVLFLGGPEMMQDGIDNPKGECNEGINGLNFGDSIVDNERLGLTGFVYYNNSNSVMGEPSSAVDYFNYMRGYWKDNSHILYGGTGHYSSGAVGPDCRFMFPGDSDTCNWGTNGLWPNGGYNQNGLYWDETSSVNTPSDRRGLGISGPFTLVSGQTTEFDQAFVFARDFGGTNLSSVDILEERCAYLKALFEYDENLFNSLDDYTVPLKAFVHVFPNPARDFVTFTVKSPNQNLGAMRVIISSGQGKCVSTTTIPACNSSFRISVSDLESGMYFYTLVNNESIIGSGKLIVR